MAGPVYNQQPYTKNRPCARKDSQGNVIPTAFSNMAFQGVYTGTNLIYACFARPGSSVNDAVWQIFKMTYDGSNNITAIQWPQNTLGKASNDYQFIQANFASFTYS